MKLKEGILLILGLLMGFMVVNMSFGVNNVIDQNVYFNSNTVAPTVTVPPQPGIPLRLKIEKLNIDAPVENVGLDSENKMDVPKDADNGGWFEYGFRPGEKGNAVIAGHLDKITGAPAIFYNLSSLEAGDKIEIVDDKEKNYTFSVVKIAEYPYDNFPLQEVFGTNVDARLNLITCNGVYDLNKKTYLKRLVVYTQLLQ